MNRKLVAIAAGTAAVGSAAAIAVASIAGAQPSSAPAAPPTVEDLSAKINAVMDPSAAAQSRGEAPDVVEGSGQDPLLYDPAAVAAGDTVVNTVEVTTFSVDEGGNTALATVTVFANGVPNEKPGLIPFVNDSGQWKISREYICALSSPEGQPPQPGCE